MAFEPSSLPFPLQFLGWFKRTLDPRASTLFTLFKIYQWSSLLDRILGAKSHNPQSRNLVPAPYGDIFGISLGFLIYHSKEPCKIHIGHKNFDCGSKNLGFQHCKKGISYKHRWLKYNWPFFFPPGSLMIDMDPSCSDIKRILCKHEDMEERSGLNFTQLSRTIANQEQINMSLL